MKEERKDYIKNGWIFNLESMHDKCWCLIYDIRDDIIKCPFTVAGKIINDESDLMDLMDEASDLEWIAKSRKVTSKEYGRIKAIVTWRVEQRYMTCLNAGLDENVAAGAFSDL